jgi:hypothetical protein
MFSQLLHLILLLFPHAPIHYYHHGWYLITGKDSYIGSIRPPGFTGGEPKAPMPL